MAGRRRTTPDNPSPAESGEGLLPADYELADLYNAFATHGESDEDLDDSAVLVPPIQLPPEEELVAAALAVPLIDHALKLARWTAPHRAVDELGDLTEADQEPAARLLGYGAEGAELDEEDVVEAMRAWSLACDLELIEIGTTAEGEHVAIPGPDLEPAEEKDADTVLELWLTAAGIVRELAAEADSLDLDGQDGAEPGEDEVDRLAEVEEHREEAAELLDEALQVLYEHTAFAEPGQETVPLGVLAALLVVPEGEEPDEELLGDITDLMVALDPMLADLAELGVLEHRPIDPELFEEEEEEQGGIPVIEAQEGDAERFGLVRLTPLGQYAVRQWLLEDGYEAPLVGELAEGDAEALLRGISETANVLPHRELAVWLAGREPEAAARELLAAAKGTDTYSPVRRMLCVQALELLGPAARPAAAEVTEDEELGGAARSWLRAQGEEVTAPERGMVLWTMVDTFAAQLLTSEGEAGLLQELVRGLPVTDNPASFFGEVWRVPHPYTADVLEAVGELHLERNVAKEARKAAFKARSQNK
ncbi:hypothetical protein CFP65_5486 [Kitasatospora sp. MMS16-BH015]|uniref:hypothetical protein n=1 Tax=Kitasatospora sp. MMS16-BH015 TaxID=2018025 RepID=UPI000CA17BEA|nr:hypothetical protein [Kitasatospora sp. MMS16-BH015]AUG80186.1 hypothetical protein CFP65_5486 [Kitasatospora sp. MMS16-BH015]